MPKKNWRAPEPRSFPVRVNYTAAEINRIDALAQAARTERAVYIRELSLGAFVPGRARTATIDSVRFAKILGALHAVGEPLKLLVDLLADGEDPRHAHWKQIEDQLAEAIQTLTKVLEAL